MMSFLEEIRLQKSRLSRTETIVKTVSGQVMKEFSSPDGSVSVEKLPVKYAGFVVDMKPDLRVDQIMDRLYMGSQDPTQHLQLLNRFNIKHILSVGIKIAPLFETISYKYIEALDVPEFDLMAAFEASYHLIDEVVRVRRENVYVHCNAGVSRSAALVIAYLMRANRISYHQALHLVTQSRTGIKPNHGFIKQLQLYDKHLKQQI